LTAQESPNYPNWIKNPIGALQSRTERSLGKIDMLILLLIILVLLMIGSAPAWPYSRGWGYYPSGGIGTILLILLILYLLGII